MNSVKAPNDLRGDNASVPPSKFQQLLQKRTEQALAEKRMQEIKSADMTRAQLNYKPQPSQRFQQMLKDRIEKVLAERKAPSSSPTSTSMESDCRDSSEVIAGPNPLSPDIAAPGQKNSTSSTVEEHSRVSPEKAATPMPKSNLVLEGHNEQQINKRSPQSEPSTILLQQQKSSHQQARHPHIQPRLATDPGKLKPISVSNQNSLVGVKRRMGSLTVTATTTVAATTTQVSNESSNVTVVSLATQETKETRVAQATQEAREPPLKRIKKSTPTGDNSACTCSISTKCEVAANNGVKDCRTIPHRVIRKSFSKPKSMSQRHEYISKRRQTEISRSNSEILEILPLIKKIEAGADLERSIARLRDRIHFLEVYEIPESSIESIKAKFLEPQNGLPSIIRNHNLIPWDIRLDCHAILKRMEKGNFNVDISRGILTKRTFRENGRSSVSRVLDKNYPFKESAFVIGDNHLRNGQWFPWQICALRDGAHGDIEGGISGNKLTGAVSIVLSSSGGGGNQMYADVDQGDTVWYCGTRGKNGEVSANTALLLEAANRKSDIRVLRSSKLPKVNPYRPSEGIRYDGLYNICDYEILDQQTALHRFKLERVKGQTPIRYKGPEIRPTTREVEELRKAYKHNAESKPAKETKVKQPVVTPAVERQT
ncbi:hypothetical protein MGYG_07427 [Nannizzia gypsea CBS 118893]|uniref:YDG domain-containing protein n=1 Tax=Arthroderma gypseum (strain ATCC MYA-4604 / CBS 118893) TaxID=535722 RepID=E4V346_ARTGP|nr:hypothetical protein MGYG_07427 [Nannizzia gypsea CBS 118893]EFR04420.1 hypothetical protein MGYG_07427 [Nannizzia gypsea CBS 118893]